MRRVIERVISLGLPSFVGIVWMWGVYQAFADQDGWKFWPNLALVILAIHLLGDNRQRIAKNNFDKLWPPGKRKNATH